MGKNERAEEPQPGRRIRPGHSGDAQPLERRRQAVAGAFEPEQMQEQDEDQRDGDDPRLDRAERRAPALGQRGEQGQQRRAGSARRRW